ncbi:hypothetical protein [Nocardia beijingensis]|uniref:Uncharacterized protein n=1 Tax=Nocardia beijingensis TaxID=95162 RepID=A0ABW7W7B3_9NOCA
MKSWITCRTYASLTGINLKIAGTGCHCAGAITTIARRVLIGCLLVLVIFCNRRVSLRLSLAQTVPASGPPGMTSTGSITGNRSTISPTPGY